MAIIKGFKALEVGEADWLQTDISDVKEALKNQQDRYDAASLELAEMAEKMNFDVRDNEEDYAEREKIAAEYYRRIREAEENFGGDLSRLNKGFYKEQASEVLRDPMVRHLMETKKEADEVAKLKREIEKEHGEAIMFGNDARYDSLLDAQGRFRNFKDVSIQKHLDHIPVINEMADNLGETISEQLRIINADDDDFKALDPGRRKLLSDEILLEINTHYSDNTYQIRTIIDNLADSFRNTPAGSQLYNRMLREEMALTNDPDVAAKIAFERLNFAMRNQIEARIKQKYAEKASLHKLPYYQNKGGSVSDNNNHKRKQEEKPKPEVLPTPVITQNEFSQTAYNSNSSMIYDLNSIRGIKSDKGMVLETGKSVISQQTSIYSTSGVLNAPVHASKDLRDNNTKNKIPNKAISTPNGFVEAAHENLVGNRGGNTNGYNPALAQINRLKGSGTTQLERIVSYSVFDNDINSEDEYRNLKSNGTELGSYIGNYEDLDTLATLKAIQNLKNNHPTLVGVTYDQVRNLTGTLKTIVDIEKNKVLQELVGGDGDLFTTLKASVGDDFSLKIAVSEELYMMKEALDINRKYALSQTKNESQIAAINASYDRSRKNLDYKIAFGEGVKKLAFLEGDELMEEIKKFSNESGIDADLMESYILNLKPIINNHHSMVQKYETLKGTIDVILSGQDLEESEKEAILDPMNPKNFNQPATKEINRIRGNILRKKITSNTKDNGRSLPRYTEREYSSNPMLDNLIINAMSMAAEDVINGKFKDIGPSENTTAKDTLNYNIAYHIANTVMASIKDYATPEEYEEVRRKFLDHTGAAKYSSSLTTFSIVDELYDVIDGRQVFSPRKAEIIRTQVYSEINNEIGQSKVLNNTTKGYAMLSNAAQTATRRHMNTYSLLKGATDNDDMYETYKGAVMASATAAIQSMAFPTDDPSYNIDNMPRLAIHDNKGRKIDNIGNLAYEMLTFDHPIAKQIMNAMSESERKDYNTIDKALIYLISKDTNLRGITVDFDTQIYRNENGTFSGKPFTVNFNVPIMTNDGTASSVLIQIPLADMSLELLMAAGVPSHLIYYAGQVSADYTENKKAGFTLEAPYAKKLGDTSTKRQFIRIPVDTKIGNVQIAAGSIIMIDAPLGNEYDSVFDYIKKNQMNKDKPGGFYVFKDESQAIYKYHSMYGGNPKDDVLKRQADLKKRLGEIESQYPKGIGGAVNPTAYQMIKNELGTSIADDYMYFGGVEGWSAAMSVRVKEKLKKDGVIGPKYVIANENLEGSDLTFTITSSSEQNKNNDGTDYQSSAKGGTEQLSFKKASGSSYTPKREDVLGLGSRGILQLYTTSRRKQGFSKTNDPIIAIYEKVVESGKSLENNDELKILGYQMTNIAKPGEEPIYDIYRSGVPIDYNRDSEYFMTSDAANKQVLKLNKGVVPAATPELRNIANLFFDDFITRDEKNGYDKDRYGDIIVTSMGRGVGHNIAVYANDFGRLTQSDHMDGNAMDISINESTASGKKLKSWIIQNQYNEKLLEFLKANDIYLLLHAIEGQAYHLHFQYKKGGGKLEIKANQHALKEKMENDKNNKNNNKKTKK